MGDESWSGFAEAAACQCGARASVFAFNGKWCKTCSPFAYYPVLQGTQEAAGASQTLPEPEDSQTCSCELSEEPSPHPICDVFEGALLHPDACVTCYHAEECH